MLPAASHHESIKVSVPPTVEPLTVADATLFLRLDSNDEDFLIESLISAARMKLEQDTGLRMITQTIVLTLDTFPSMSGQVHLRQPLESLPPILPVIRDPVIYLPGPIQSVTSIGYIDTTGASQTLASDQYIVDSQSVWGRLTPAPSTDWPGVQARHNSVTITYQAGYGNSASDVPSDLIHAMRLLVSHWYETRTPVLAGERTVVPNIVPMAYESLMWSRRYVEVV